MRILSGSINTEKYSLTPFEKAESNIFQFLMNMHACYTFNELSDRITLINTMMALPVMSSSVNSINSMIYESTRSHYEDEIREIEQALKVYCTMMNVPEA